MSDRQGKPGRGPLVAMDLALDDLRHARFLQRSLNRPPGPRPPSPADPEFTRLLDDAGAPPVPAPSAPPPPPPYVLLRGDALTLPFADGAFDRVICSEVLEHVSDPAAAAVELARVLRPGGSCAVSVPTAFTEWAMRFGSDDYFNTPGGHVRIFTVQDAMDLLEQHGLTVRDLHFEHAFHTLYWWVRCVFGLHDEGHPTIRHFRRVLTRHVLPGPDPRRARLRLAHPQVGRAVRGEGVGGGGGPVPRSPVEDGKGQSRTAVTSKWGIPQVGDIRPQIPISSVNPRALLH